MNPSWDETIQWIEKAADKKDISAIAILGLLKDKEKKELGPNSMK